MPCTIDKRTSSHIRYICVHVSKYFYGFHISNASLPLFHSHALSLYDFTHAVQSNVAGKLYSSFKYPSTIENCRKGYTYFVIYNICYWLDLQAYVFLLRITSQVGLSDFEKYVAEWNNYRQLKILSCMVV